MGFSSAPNPKEFQATVWEIARLIPVGNVSTYGQISSMIPPPGSLTLKDYEAFGPRWVGGAMANCPADVPWHRVINAQGKISSRPGAGQQKLLLLKEGITFDEKDRINFDLFGWTGPQPEWCRAHGLFTPKPLGRFQPPLF